MSNYSQPKLEASILALIPDLPVGGPLELFRKQSTFDWKKLKIYLEGELSIQLQNWLFNITNSDPIFQTHSVDMTSEDQKFHLHKLQTALLKYNLNELPLNSSRMRALVYSVAFYNWPLIVKRTLGYEFFSTTLLSESSQMEDVISDVTKGKIIGCLAITEVGTGSNLQAIKTKAVYDPLTEEFVLNSPNFLSWKCWIGNLGRSATHANVLAQLYTPDGKCHGLHIFCVPIRNPLTMKTLPGVTVGDLGVKIGNVGIDNGFLAFNDVRIPRKNFLNRRGDVTKEGRYISAIKDSRKRFAETVGHLNYSRILTPVICLSSLAKAITIAVRYALVRKQFGPANAEESSIITFQLHQWRILPYLSSWFVLSRFMWCLVDDFQTYQESRTAGHRGMQETAYSFEIHTAICAAKPIVTWLTRDAIQECREACGANGYLKASGIGELRNDIDATLTWEGDNNILHQQTSKNLLGLLQQKRNSSSAQKSILGCFSFIDKLEEILQNKCEDQDVDKLLTPDGLLATYEWLICYLLRESEAKYKRELAAGKDIFSAFSNSQVYYCRSLALAFGEYAGLHYYFNYMRQHPPPPDSSVILDQLGMTFGLWKLEQQLVTFYQGDYFESNKPIQVIHNAILDLCSKLHHHAARLTDAIAPPDFCMNSVLGKSDGQIYRRLAETFLQSNNSFDTRISPHLFSTLDLEDGNIRNSKGKL